MNKQRVLSILLKAELAGIFIKLRKHEQLHEAYANPAMHDEIKQWCDDHVAEHDCSDCSSIDECPIREIALNKYNEHKKIITPYGFMRMVVRYDDVYTREVEIKGRDAKEVGLELEMDSMIREVIF